MPHLVRTEFVLESSKSHFDSLPSVDSEKALVGVFLTFLVCVSFYSELEAKVLEIVRDRMSVANDPKLSNLIESSKKSVFSRVSKSDLAACAEMFGKDVKAAFNTAVTPIDVSLYSNVINQRHIVAHSDNGRLIDWKQANLTLIDVEQGLMAAERLLNAFKSAIQK